MRALAANFGRIVGVFVCVCARNALAGICRDSFLAQADELDAPLHRDAIESNQSYFIGPLHQVSTSFFIATKSAGKYGLHHDATEIRQKLYSSLKHGLPQCVTCHDRFISEIDTWCSSFCADEATARIDLLKANKDPPFNCSLPLLWEIAIGNFGDCKATMAAYNANCPKDCINAIRADIAKADVGAHEIVVDLGCHVGQQWSETDSAVQSSSQRLVGSFALAVSVLFAVGCCSIYITRRFYSTSAAPTASLVAINAGDRFDQVAADAEDIE